jgi:hypothetical protein
MTPTQMIGPAIHRRPAGYNDSELAQSRAIRARAIFPISAKIMVALVRVDYHHAPMKICD